MVDSTDRMIETQWLSPKSEKSIMINTELETATEAGLIIAEQINFQALHYGNPRSRSDYLASIRRLSKQAESVTGEKFTPHDAFEIIQLVDFLTGRR